MLNTFVPFLKEGKEMDWAEYSRILMEKCKARGVPYGACFEMTPFCNFRCNMCFVRLDPDQARKQGRLLTTEQWIRFAEEAKKMGTTALEITGGEASTREDFPILYETFVKMGFVVNLRTNGYLMSGKILELLKKYKPLRVGISLYGASDETYKRVCGVPDGFTVVTRNILAMRDAGLNIHLTMTITKENEHDMKPLNEWAKSHNLTVRPFGGLFTPVRGAKRSIDHLRITYSEDDCEITDDMEFLPHSVPDREKYMNPFWMCRGFGAIYCISWDGRMTLCNGFTTIWKDPVKDGLEKAFHELYEDLRKLKRPKECETCEYIDFCASCPTQMVSASGSVDTACEEICRRARRKYKRVLLKNGDNTQTTDPADYYCDEGEDTNEDQR